MKIKRIILSLILVISCFWMVSCKNDNGGDGNKDSGNQKQTPAVSVTISRDTRYVGDRLGDIELKTIGECTPGTLAWENENYLLVYGENTCKWIFTPTDTETYNIRSGVIVIDAKGKLADVTVSDVKIKDDVLVYIDAPYSSIELKCNSSVEGTIAWKTPNAIFTSGENVCEWIFTPTENDLYQTKKGTITVNATQEQYLSEITVKSNTKKSGYKAFDVFDCSGLTLNLIYNAGKITPVSNVESDCTVRYETDNCLHRGDTKVTVTYSGVDFEVVIDEVDYKTIDRPVFSDIIVYDGTVKTLRVVSSYLYSFTPLQKTDAGEYDLELTLTDKENYKWSDSETETTTVKCSIQKAELSVTENEYQGTYDGEKHAPTVSGAIVDTVYYSLSPLNFENYLTGSESFEGFADAGFYSIYYYAIGDKNHNNLAGMITCKINKQTPVMNLTYCYTIKTGSAVNYPVSYVSLESLQGQKLENKNLTFTYYISYSDDGDDSNDIKTSFATGASVVGGAPVNERSSNYVVVVEYAGDGKNFDATSSSIALYIDSADNGFYDTTGSSGFAFKDDVYEYVYENSPYSIVGSNKECGKYLEFRVLPVNEFGLIEVEYTSKFNTGNENVKTGKLVYDEGYQLVGEDGEIYLLEFNESKDMITIAIDNNPVELSKWLFPKYLKSFAAETISEENMTDKNTSNITTLSFYNDNGTIRFSADINVQYKENEFLGSKGGHVTWSGVAEAIIDRDENQKLCYVLKCFIISENSLESEGYQNTSNWFSLKWFVTADGKVEPDSLTYYKGNPELSTPYDALKTTFNAV